MVEEICSLFRRKRQAVILHRELNHPGEDSSGWVRSLEGLRGIAAGAVILDHIFVWTLGFSEGSLEYQALTGLGSMGVGVFFLISGYLIGKSVRRGSLRRFTLLRLARVYPVAIATISATWCYKYLSETPNSKTIDLADWAASASLLGSWWIPIGSLIEPITWTLSVEIAFYLLIAITWRLSGLSRESNRVQRQMMLVALLGLLFSIYNLIFASLLNPANVAASIAATCVPIILMGSAIEVMKNKALGSNRAAQFAFAINFAAFFTTKATWFLEPKVLVSYAIALIIFLLAINGLTKWLFTNAVAQKLGQWAFPLYMVHPLVYTFVLSQQHLYISNLSRALIMILLSLVLAGFLHQKLEMPVYNSARKVIQEPRKFRSVKDKR